MQVKCVILKVDKPDSEHTSLILQPLLENCPAFPFLIHKPVFDYQVGNYIDIPVADIVGLYVACAELYTETKSPEELK